MFLTVSYAGMAARFSHALVASNYRITAFALKPELAMEPLNPASRMLQRSRISPASLIGVALAHAGLLGLLVLAPDTPERIAPPDALIVSLIEPAAEEAQPEPQPKPQPPKPVIESTPPPPVLIAKPTPVPVQPVDEAPKPTPVPVQPVDEAPKPTPVSEPVPEVLPPAPVAEAPKPAPPRAPARPADYLDNPKPPYPALSKRLGEEGVVSLRILVNPDGSVSKLELVQSSGYQRLDKSAIETVQASWKFEPARQGGEPVTGWVIVPIQFTLGS